MGDAEQLGLFPERVCVDGIWGTVEARFPGQVLVRFDGEIEWAEEYRMASHAGCALLVALEDCGS